MNYTTLYFFQNIPPTLFPILTNNARNCHLYDIITQLGGYKYCFCKPQQIMFRFAQSNIEQQSIIHLIVIAHTSLFLFIGHDFAVPTPA